MNEIFRKENRAGALETQMQARMKRLYEDASGTEEVALRDENVKHFNLGANRRQAVVYSQPVHFRDSEGHWQEIDNTLESAITAQGRRVLRNRAGRMRVEFPQQADGGSMASITENGSTFAWRFEQEAQPVLAVARTGAQLKQERLVAQAQAMPKFVGRTAESLKAADLTAEMRLLHLAVLIAITVAYTLILTKTLPKKRWE